MGYVWQCRVLQWNPYLFAHFVYHWHPYIFLIFYEIFLVSFNYVIYKTKVLTCSTRVNKFGVSTYIPSWNILFVSSRSEIPIQNGQYNHRRKVIHISLHSLPTTTASPLEVLSDEQWVLYCNRTTSAYNIAHFFARFGVRNDVEHFSYLQNGGLLQCKCHSHVVLWSFHSACRVQYKLVCEPLILLIFFFRKYRGCARCIEIVYSTYTTISCTINKV